jgi:sRNA-binding regulator protein Hfq
MTEFIPAELDRYCYWQTERESIRIKKESAVLSPPWTDDSILQEFKFCQVFREDDRTTRWFRTHIREPMRNEEDVLMATIIFRWFNLIETGRTLIDHGLLRKWNRKKAIYEITKQPKWITGAYIIKTPNGMDKVTGVAECISHIWKARESILSRLHENLAKGESSLEATWLILRDYPYMGPFMAYEVVTDLRHTYLLENANDIMTWANAGPGAMRGLNRLTGRPLDYSRKSHPWCEEMQDLFEQVKKILAPSIIFRNGANYEMREIEGGLCEFDKYSRIYKSEGRTRSVYKHNDLPMVEDLIEGESKYGWNER